MGVGGQRHAPAALPPGKRRGTHFIGGWVGPRAGLGGCGKYPYFRAAASFFHYFLQSRGQHFLLLFLRTRLCCI